MTPRRTLILSLAILAALLVVFVGVATTDRGEEPDPDNFAPIEMPTGSTTAPSPTASHDDDTDDDADRYDRVTPTPRDIDDDDHDDDRDDDRDDD